MGLLQVPAFTWSMLVACAIWLLTLPVVIANIALIYVDLRGREPIAFGNPQGPDIWLQLDWMVEQPAVYAMAIPVLGIAIDAMSSSFKTRLARSEAPTIAIGLFGLLAAGGWSQDYFTSPVDHRDELVYVAMGLAAVVAVLAVFGALGELTLRSVKRPNDLLTPATFAKLFEPGAIGAGTTVKLLGFGAVIGAVRVIEPLDLLETAATSAVFHAVSVAALASGVTALSLWVSQAAGRGLPPMAGRAIPIVLVLAGGLLALADLAAGLRETLNLPANISPDGGIDGLIKVASLAGSVLLVLGVLAALPAAVSALRSAHTMKAAT